MQKLLYEQFFGLFNLLEMAFYTAKSDQTRLFFLPTGDFFDFYEESTYVTEGPSLTPNKDTVRQLMKSALIVYMVFSAWQLRFRHASWEL